MSDELAASSAFFSLGSTPTSVVEQCERIKRKGSETVRRKTLRDGRGRSGVGVRPSVRVAAHSVLARRWRAQSQLLLLRI